MRYINASMLKNSVVNLQMEKYARKGCDKAYKALSTVLDIIDRMPEASPPSDHAKAHWETIILDGRLVYTCSECGVVYEEDLCKNHGLDHIYIPLEFNCCPNCGAKMVDENSPTRKDFCFGKHANR